MTDFEIFLIVLASVASVILVAVAIYLFFLIRPSAKKPQNKKLLCDYAHRGLHKGNEKGTAPENSLLAFDLAANAGYGIELDVQLSSDGVVMVFHDDTLVRMTGKEGNVKDYTAAELSSFTLADSDQTIPTFRQVLDLVNGRVPLLVELKGESTDTSLCPKVAEILREYKGDYCLESFNPFLIGEMKKQLPSSYRGLLYTDACKDKGKVNVTNVAVTMMLLNFIAKPNFIAYNKICRNCLPVKITTGFFRAPKFVWTTRCEDEIAAAHQNGEYPIFEKLD